MLIGVPPVFGSVDRNGAIDTLLPSAVAFGQHRVRVQRVEQR